MVFLYEFICTGNITVIAANGGAGVVGGAGGSGVASGISGGAGGIGGAGGAGAPVYAGGLVSYTTAVVHIESSYATGNVTATAGVGGTAGNGGDGGAGGASSVGGAGANGGAASIGGDAKVGGLVGLLGTGDVNVSYSTGIIQGDRRICGLWRQRWCWRNWWIIADRWKRRNRSHGRNAGSSFTGGLVGDSGATIQGSYHATGTVTGIAGSGGNGGAGGNAGSSGSITNVRLQQVATAPRVDRAELLLLEVWLEEAMVLRASLRTHMQRLM